MHTPETRGERGDFFDHIASNWDERVATPAFMARLRAAVDDLGIGTGETVLDLGCGTGNLTLVLAERLTDGRAVAVDYSDAMLDIARSKLGVAANVEFTNADARALPAADASYDRVICFSAWPHFAEHPRVARELLRVLRPGGLLHVLHIDGRDTINRVHGAAGGAVAHDMLRPAADLEALFVSVGFAAVERVDSAERYLVTVRRAGV